MGGSGSAGMLGTDSGGEHVFSLSDSGTPIDSPVSLKLFEGDLDFWEFLDEDPFVFLTTISTISPSL